MSICRFTKGMMLKLNNIRNKANAIHVNNQIHEHDITEHVIRFPYSMIIGLSDRGESGALIMEPQMRRFDKFVA